MPAAGAFEDADDAISWDKMQYVLSPQQSAHGCSRVVFDVIQRLKSRRYSTVLNTFTVRDRSTVSLALAGLCLILAFGTPQAASSDSMKMFTMRSGPGVLACVIAAHAKSDSLATRRERVQRHPDTPEHLRCAAAAHVQLECW